MFRGRETTHPERGRDLLLRLADDVKEIGQIESQPLLDGRNMVMVLGPTKAAGLKADEAHADDADAAPKADGEAVTETVAEAAPVAAAELELPEEQEGQEE